MPEKRHDVLSFLAIFVAALVLRLLFLIENSRTDAFALLLGDARVYDALARRIAAGQGAGNEVFYQAPLYPYFLAAVYKLAGPGTMAVRMVQAVLGAASCLLLAEAGRLFFSRRVGLVAGTILAFYPSAIFFDATIQKTSLDLFFLAALLALLGWRTRRRSAALAIGAGVVLGLLCLTRENALLFVPVIAAWLYWGDLREDRPREDRPREDRLRETGRRDLGSPAGRWRRPPRPAVLFLAGWLVVLLPVAIRNAAVGGQFTLTTSQGGSNFYIGNNPSANGTYVPLVAGRGDAQFERSDAVLLAEQEAGRQLSPGEVSGFWTRKAFNFMRTQPGAWLRLTGRKVLLALNAVELGDTEDQYAYASWSAMLRLLTPILSWGVLFPIAAAGIVLSWASRRRSWILYALSAVYLAGLVAFFVVSRYRMPLVPLLLPFAALALVAARDTLRPRPGAAPGDGREAPTRRTWVRAGIALGIAAVVAWLPLAKPAASISTTHANLAAALVDQADRLPSGSDSDLEKAQLYKRAGSHLDEALRRDPRSANAHHLRGVILASTGAPDRAREEYRQALALEPGRALTHFKLGELLLSQDQVQPAIAMFRTGLEIEPSNPRARNNLGIALARVGRLEEARVELDKARAADPTLAGTDYNLGLALAQAGKFPEAEATFRRLLADQPDNLAGRQNLAAVLLRTGRPREAAREMEEILKREPGRVRTVVQLARIYALHPDATARDGARAEALVRQALGTATGDPLLLDLLASAQAEQGRFDLAVATAEQALAAARGRGPAELQSRIEGHLELFRQRKPARETP